MFFDVSQSRAFAAVSAFAMSAMLMAYAIVPASPAVFVA